MDCREARHLLDQGITPGSTSPERAALGFHLARCPACRTYRAMLQERLLANLLSLDAKPAPKAARPVTPPSDGERVRASFVQALWYAGLALLGAIVLAVVIVLGQAVLSIYHIHQNV